ncbi:hypothetical protein ACJMK2_028466 [Sinanodonta woodiana]|uniref:SOCS box domain-containing protein n=1 Tax=Sinanodonta woodiana TaxID=1069815 RepID=A0ABD3X7K4_SINWO
MGGFLDLSYRCLCYLYDCFRTTWPISLVYGSKLRQPTFDTVSKVLRIIYYLHNQDHQSPESVSLAHIIGSLPEDEDILSIFNGVDQYNVLQHAVLVNCEEAVCLILKKLDGNVQHYSCNAPIHLAAFLGHYRILQNLVDKFPGDVSVSHGLCYPEEHVPVSEQRRFGIFIKSVYRCELEQHFPTEFAVIGDHVDCLKLLENRCKSNAWKFPTPSSLLHLAASNGAAKCLQYFVTQYSDHINEPDSEGDAPLLKAVVWGRDCSKILIENGADVNVVSKNGDTALHRLYRNDIDGIFAIFDTTRYLLSTGIEQLINAVNFKGETALHILVTHVSYIGGNYFHSEQRNMPRWQLQPDYQEQVIQTIELLMEFNADPAIYDLNYLQPISKLFHVAQKASMPHDSYPCVQRSIDSKYIYSNDFNSLKRATAVLLHHNSDVNSQCAIGHTPLISLLQCIMNTAISDLIQQADDIIGVLEVLLRNGANPNFMTDKQETCSTLLARIASRYFILRRQMHGTANSQALHALDQFVELVNHVLRSLLMYGLHPNHTSQKRSPFMSGGKGNALIEFVRLAQYASSTVDLEAIYKLLTTLLQWGADPDLEPYPSEPIICHSQSSIFLKKQGTHAVNHYIHEIKELESVFQDGNAEKLLHLFYNSMDHKVLFDCLNMARFIARSYPLGATGQDFVSLLNQLTENPRSLKQCARVTIYKAMDRKIARGVDQLPLPNALKNYLLNFE